MNSDWFRRVSLAASRLETAALDKGRLKLAFADVADALGGGMFQLINVTNPSAPELIVAPGYEGLHHDYILNGWHEIDIWTHAARMAPSSRGLLQTELIDPEIRRRDAFFQEFCPRWGIGRFDAWTFDLGGEMWGYTFMASDKKAPSQALNEMLQALMPAANRSAALASIVQDAMATGIANGLEMGGRPCIILNHVGKVELLTKSAEALLGQGFDVRRGELVGLTARTERHLRMLSQQARVSRPQLLPNFAIDRLDGRRPLLAMPVSLRDRELDGLPGARLILMLADLEIRTVDDDHGRLHALFRLTPREAEIARHLASGASLEQIGETLEITLHTVRAMLKSIFAKTNTNRQMQLVALLAKVLS